MASYPRYALAIVCLAASVGCLALWVWTSIHRTSRLAAIYPAASRTVYFMANDGDITVGLGHPLTTRQTARGVRFAAVIMDEQEIRGLQEWRLEFGRFSYANLASRCPTWYPALIFTLAGVGVLRFRRQFSIRSALVCLSVVAALLGMVVVL